MNGVLELVIAFIISSLTTLLVTPILIVISKRLNVIDRPNNRKIHSQAKPTLGGLAIFAGVLAGFLYLQPFHEHMLAIIIGACIMLLTGLIDDLIDLKPLYKLIGQIASAIVVVSSGLIIDKMTIPFIGTVSLGGLGVIMTILWIVAASNAINLIDGLDGLAAGVSAIGLSSVLVMAILDAQVIVIYLTIILIGSCLGFLYHNFYPSKIFMGDTGALFLGYSIAIVSMLGLFKNVAFFSSLVPMIVLAIPIFDTIHAIIRRRMSNRSIASADKNHLHYELMKMGYSHRVSVLIIYAFSIFFGLMAIIFNSATLLSSFIILLIIILGVQLIAEIAGVTLHNRQPLLNRLRRFVAKREQ